MLDMEMQLSIGWAKEHNQPVEDSLLKKSKASELAKSKLVQAKINFYSNEKLFFNSFACILCK